MASIPDHLEREGDQFLCQADRGPETSITNLTVNESNQPNDLLDQRDQLITELNKYVKATVQPGAGNSITVSIGSGQPLVVGSKNQLAATPSPTDPAAWTWAM
jgi:flagellar hook-associated protein 1 FlgK